MLIHLILLASLFNIYINLHEVQGRLMGMPFVSSDHKIYWIEKGLWPNDGARWEVRGAAKASSSRKHHCRKELLPVHPVDAETFHSKGESYDLRLEQLGGLQSHQDSPSGCQGYLTQIMEIYIIFVALFQSKSDVSTLCTKTFLGTLCVLSSH